MSFLAAWRKSQLVKKGFSCSKTRRRQSSGEWICTLQTSWQVKAFIILGFAFGLALLIFTGDQPDEAKRYLFGLLVLVTALAQLFINHPRLFGDNSNVALIFGTCLAELAIVKAMLLLTNNASTPGAERFLGLVFPYAFAPLVLSVLLGKNQGIYAAIFASLWGSILTQNSDGVFLAMSLISGFVAVFVTLQVRRRGQLLRAGFFVGVAVWMLALSFGLIEIQWGALRSTNWSLVGWQSLAAVGSAVLISVIVSGALPMLESVFRITTPISWLEMGDLNHPLLKQLSTEAPGTYYHSQGVARLSEAAAEAIGANALMCQTCSYFHDIGKLVKPEYFAENLAAEALNPHDDLAPTMSALIIVSHVKDGVDLALKHKLKKEIVDVIQQHHGNSMVYYFYKRGLQQYQDCVASSKMTGGREEDIPEVSEENFRYKGPLPQTKECAIISLADAVESSSRCLEKPTPQRIEQLINDVIDSRVADHQLDDCALTFQELRIIAESFRFTLQSMLHRRIAYPKEENVHTAASSGFNLATTGAGDGASLHAAERERDREKKRSSSTPNGAPPMIRAAHSTR